MTEGTPREVAERMGFGCVSLRPIGNEFTNDHWRVATVGREVVYLRRSAEERRLAEVVYEVEVRDRLARCGWPVPRALTSPIVSGGRVWCVFEAKPGRPRRPRSGLGIVAEQRARGRLLAHLHADTEGLAGLGQRPGWHRSEDSFARLEPLLDRLARTHQAEARALREHLETTRAQLDELGAARQPARIVHGDFSMWNLLYSHGELTAVLDFDLAHLNHRVADFAISWRGVHDEVVHAYDEVSPLEPVEWELLTPVFSAWFLMTAQERLAPEYKKDINLHSYLLEHLNRRPALKRRRVRS